MGISSPVHSSLVFYSYPGIVSVSSPYAADGITPESFKDIKAELNPKAGTLDLYAYLELFLLLNNIPKCKKSQSNHFLTTLTYIHTGGIADPWADWAMISNRPGNNKKGRQLTIACNGIKFSFPRFIWFCWAAIFFYFHQVLSVVWWLETLDTLGYVWALEQVSYELINPTYMFKGLRSALMLDNLPIF